MSKKAGTALSNGVSRRRTGDEKLVFEVPIYRCTKDQFSDEMEKERATCLGTLKKLQGEAPVSFAAAENRFDETESYSWLYNEAIGWIQLSVHGTEIKGELYIVKAKGVRRRMRKRFRWAGDLFQVDVFPNDSSTKIYNTIFTELDLYRSELGTQKRYLDTEAFQNTGPFVNWRRLVRS